MKVRFRWINFAVAKFHVRAANIFWINRANKPAINRGMFAPPPTLGLLWRLVRFPGGAYGGVVKEGTHANFVRALHGREVTINNETVTLNYSPAREFTPPTKLVDLWGDGSIFVSDTNGIEAEFLSDSTP